MRQFIHSSRPRYTQRHQAADGLQLSAGATTEERNLNPSLSSSFTRTWGLTRWFPMNASHMAGPPHTHTRYYVAKAMISNVSDHLEKLF